MGVRRRGGGGHGGGGGGGIERGKRDSGWVGDKTKKSDFWSHIRYLGVFFATCFLLAVSCF